MLIVVTSLKFSSSAFSFGDLSRFRKGLLSSWYIFRPVRRFPPKYRGSWSLPELASNSGIHWLCWAEKIHTFDSVLPDINGLTMLNKIWKMREAVVKSLIKFSNFNVILKKLNKHLHTVNHKSLVQDFWMIGFVSSYNFQDHFNSYKTAYFQVCNTSYTKYIVSFSNRLTNSFWMQVARSWDCSCQKLNPVE